VSKFNTAATRPAAKSPVVTEARPSGVTHEGAPGYTRDAKGELFLLAVSNMVGENTFYEKAGDRDERYENLVGQVAVADPDWTGRFLAWLRDEGNMRSASLVGALEAARALLTARMPGSRQIVVSVLQRADEPGEALAYWTSRYGRAIPKPVKRGIADAVARLYSEYALLKYDTGSRGFRFADVLDLTHPTPSAPWQGDLFACALARRHNRKQTCAESLPMLAANALLRAAAVEDASVMLDPNALKQAGMTWEDALSLVGSKVDKASLWSALIPAMGYMALLRNLRNFDQVEVSDEVAATVAARLADPEQVAKSRQFPFRFLAAYRAAPSLRWGHALDKALTASLSNVPELAGRTLILVDLSGSMQDRAGGRNSDMTRADVAKVFGAGLAMRTDPTLVWFDTSSGRVDVPKGGGSLLKLVESFPRAGGGTATAAAVERWYAGHDRVVLVTDEQAATWGGGPSTADVTVSVPRHVPVYTWNLAGYQYGHTPSGLGTRHTFGGLTDAAFKVIPLLEAHGTATWPF
jgi:hypothetical protein